MTKLNPDFRGADEVVVPDAIDLGRGWTDGTDSEDSAHERENKAIGALSEDMPVAFRHRQAAQFRPKMLELFNAAQKEKGRGEGSCDWTLMDEMVEKKPLLWLPQIIGSCVASNTFRAWVIRMMIQIVMYGKAEDYLGRDEWGPNNYAPYVPWSYGNMRRRGGLRSGDGGFCAPMGETLIKDGVLPCNTPKLLELLSSRGLDGPKDFPEPQGGDGTKLYREFGAWDHLDSLKPYADYPCLEAPQVRSVDQLVELLKEGKPAFVCSMIAIHKVGTHKDGFAIHKQNHGNQWAHNMAFHGFFYASDGEMFIRFSNESWGEKHIYNVPYDEVKEWFDRRRVTSMAIGEIQGPAAAAPVV